MAESQEARLRRVGFVGMGIMGAPMAANLIGAGFEVAIWNRTRAKCTPLERLGATVAPSPAALAASGVDAIALCVRDTPDVETLLFGPDGVAAGAREGLIVVDHSTIRPDATQRFAARLAERGVALLDAPVSGGDVGARNGTLTIMVGGPVDAFERALPLLRAVGKSVTHLGPSGMGQVCKAANQICVAVNLLGVCEALAFARRAGLDLERAIEVLSGGAAASWQLANLGPKLARADYAPGFRVDLARKDLAIVADTARAAGLPLAGVEIAASYLEQVAEAGGGALGTQALGQALERLGRFRYGG
jgi:3-hydroxyisobutyrate dehydrogenase